MVYINYSVSVLRKKVLEFIPNNEYYPLDSLFSYLIKKRELLSFETKQKFYEIGSIEGLKEFDYYIESSKFAGDSL